MFAPVQLREGHQRDIQGHQTIDNLVSRYCLISSETFCPALTHLSLASLLLDIGKQNSPRCDAAERGVPSGAILFAYRIFIEKLNKI